jgi:hypothetical protein
VMALLTRVKYASEMTGWTVGWFLLFAVIRLGFFRKYSADFSNRVVSIIHAVVAIYYSYLCFENGFAGMFNNVGGPNTEPQQLCMAVSLSYFVYDLVYCSVSGELESVLHHFFTIGGLASGVLHGKSGAELCACLFLMEVSNPSLHLRTLLLEMGLKNTTLFSLNNLTFASVFLACRIVVGPPLVWKTIACPTNDLIVKLGGFGILAVSIMWGWRIVAMFVKEAKKLLGAGRRRKTNDEWMGRKSFNAIMIRAIGSCSRSFTLTVCHKTRQNTKGATGRLSFSTSAILVGTRTTLTRK